MRVVLKGLSVVHIAAALIKGAWVLLALAS